LDFTITYEISAHHHWSCELESRSWRGVLDTTLCDRVCQWLTAGWWFSLCTPVSSSNKTDHHDITEILLKVALNTITITTKRSKMTKFWNYVNFSILSVVHCHSIEKFINVIITDTHMENNNSTKEISVFLLRCCPNYWPDCSIWHFVFIFIDNKLIEFFFTAFLPNPISTC
jgi:hypothetical protein